MKYVLFILSIITGFLSWSQVDAVNFNSSQLSTEKIQEGTRSYIVYMQDSLEGPKYNFEIWDRTITRTKKGLKLNWRRNSDSKRNFHTYEIEFTEKMQPISEKILTQQYSQDSINLKRKYFLYTENSMRSSEDSTLHNAQPIYIQDLKYSLNWELDLETLEALDWNEKSRYTICFYHPGSSTLPAYYTYYADRTEALFVDNRKIDCWVLKFDHSEKITTEFWLSKTTGKVLMVRDNFMGRYRFKKLIF